MASAEQPSSTSTLVESLINVYLEDFKSRGAELLAVEGENNRWRTIYTSALILGIAWILQNDRLSTVSVLCQGEKGFLCSH